MKVYSTKKGASMPKDDLNPYGVGVMRLQEMSIAIENFSENDIIHIGYCSIHRIEVVLCRVGNSWGIRGRMATQLRIHEQQFGCRGHIRAYWIVSGKRVMALRRHLNGTTEELMDAFNCRITDKPVNEMNAKEIFMVAKGKRPGRRHAPKMTSSERIASAARMEKL